MRSKIMGNMMSFLEKKIWSNWNNQKFVDFEQTKSHLAPGKGVDMIIKTIY